MNDSETSPLPEVPKVTRPDATGNDPELLEAERHTREGLQGVGLGRTDHSPSEGADIEQLKGRILEVIEQHLTHEFDWDQSGFDEIEHSTATPVNKLWIGTVEHIHISDSPPLVATVFTEKIQKNEPDAPQQRVLSLLIGEKAIKKEGLIRDYDQAVESEQIGFAVEFDFRGPTRHSLKHRAIAEKFRGGGFGSAILERYEAFFQHMATTKGETQSNVMAANKYSTVRWAAKNGYKPDDETALSQVLQNDPNITIENDDIYITSPDGTKSKLYLEMEKEFAA